MNDREEIAHAVARIRHRIERACARVGRSPESVRLLPVSKTVSLDRLRAAHAAGLRGFGENRVQEAKAKFEALHDHDIAWSIIGHLQTNKAKDVARFATEFQALDSLRVAEALERYLERCDRTLDVLVQVNTSGEASKFGLPPDEAASFVRTLVNYPRLRVRGLMTLAVFSADRALVRQCFVRLREVRDRLRDCVDPRIGLDDLSMGMSADFEIAVEEGATVVRVGQAIFGPRALPDSHFWPDPTADIGSTGESR